MEETLKKGKLHPLSHMIAETCAIFSDMGFEIADGPHIETQWHNFDALNVPKDHPARDMQDTFFIKNQPENVMRTHTSCVQIRYMEKNNKPPIKVVSPGLVFRNEATDNTHEVQFFQIEGLVVDKDITLAHLKATLQTFLKRLLGDDVEIRFRPGYFPFVEPGVEVDLKFQGKWLEVLGAGMVHPNVLHNVGIDPEIYSGFAFGPGIDRLAMMKYDIPDIRLFYQGDLRLHNSLSSF
jgi:phenylalanyl-tRNA synthetase alpha chain